MCIRDRDKPDGLFVIRPEQASEFVEQLPIRKFHGIGKVTEQKMHSLGIFTGADLKALSLVQLQTQFGQIGSYYYNIARGKDERPVSPHRKRKSVGNETTFVENVTDKKEIWQTLTRLTEKVAAILEKRQFKGRTVTLKVRYANFVSITRSKTVDPPICQLDEILAVLPELLKKTEVGKRPIRLIGVTVANLHALQELAEAAPRLDDSKLPPQLGLFSNET